MKDYHQEKTFINSHLTYKKIQQIKKMELKKKITTGTLRRNMKNPNGDLTN